MTIKDREYRAGALIQLMPRTGQELNVNEVLDLNTRGFYEIQQFFRTQIQIIYSRAMRKTVLERYAAMGFDDMPLDDGGTDTLLSILKVVPEQQSELLNIYVTHTDPERGMALANLVAEVYVEKNLSARQDASQEAKAWLESQLIEYRQNTISAQEALIEFKAKNNVVDIDEQISTLASRMAPLNETFGQQSTESVVLENNLRSHERLLRNGNYEELAKVINSPILQQLSQDLSRTQAEDATLAARYGVKHPERQLTVAKVAGLSQSIEQEVRRNIRGDRARLSVLQSSENRLGEEIDLVKDDLLAFQQLQAQYVGLKYELERNQGFFEKLSHRLDEVTLTSRTQLNNVRILDHAVLPAKPISPNVPLSLLIALVLGGLGGMGLALLREYVDDTISSQLDVSAYLKVPFLGLIPRIPASATSEEKDDLFTHYNPRSSVAEALRSIRTMLSMNPRGTNYRRLLVTSSVAREGKTTTSVSLAIAMAQSGKRVVILDADLRRPRLHKVFDADASIGVTSVLLGAAKIKDVLYPTGIPNLSAIFAGPGTDHPAEMLASDSMKAMLDNLDEHFDAIILDTPPSIALSDAVTLSRWVDGVVLVVKEQSVSRSVVKQTIDMFHQVDANLLGVILNNVDLSQSGSKYKYYYAYRDYYSSYESESAQSNSGAAAK